MGSDWDVKSGLDTMGLDTMGLNFPSIPLAGDRRPVLAAVDGVVLCEVGGDLGDCSSVVLADAVDDGA